MGLGFWQGVDEFELAFRVILTFAVVWAAAFCLVSIVYRIVGAEFGEQARQEAEHFRGETEKKEESEEETPP